MDKQKMRIDFGMQLTNFEKLNENFTRAKCYVLALGKNQNKSYFSQEVVENAYPSLAFVPVVGHLKETDDGKHYLGGHDYVLDKESLEFKSLCVPFGVAIPSESPTYESVVENGKVSKYLVSDVILWTGRYPELKEAVYNENIMFGQSMEVLFDASEPLKEDPQYTEIKSFTFDALCMLNKSDDERFNIEPCFPSASIVKADYSAIKAEFNATFEEMKNELKMYFSTIGGSNLDNADNKNVGVQSFSATYNKIRAAIDEYTRAMCRINKDEQGRYIGETNYELIDFDNDNAIVSERVYGDDGCKTKYFKFGYTFNNDDNTATFNDEGVEVSCEWLTADEREAVARANESKLNDAVSSLKEIIDTMTTEYSELEASTNETITNLNSEVSELRAFKADTEATARAEAEQKIFEKFDSKIGNVEAYSALKENAEIRSNLTIEELEEKCSAIYGRFQLSIEPQENKNEESNNLTFAKVIVDGTSQFDDVESKTVPYGGIVEEYRSKNNK
jgi:hypothetical protein